MRKFLFLIGFLLSIGIIGQASAITIQNASFEDGLDASNGWDNSGTVATSSSFYYRMYDTTFNATDGDDFAQLTGDTYIYQELSWSTGDIISFDWNFLSFDSGLLTDSWYFGVYNLNSGDLIETIVTMSFEELVVFPIEWQPFSYKFESDSKADYAIIFGVSIDPDNYSYSSYEPSVLLVDNITTTTIPEPATMFLLAFGLLSIAGIRRKL
ncbi:hypothetical protein DO021_14205 [Desulfobacter hydrogenophilus]|uniref:PEP-CTERM sorting domain-containing protein n=1 Tax=Desulfobacter hydrogenophilus TaxID=2291 RepID=A0A328F9R5_9BACT|nr:PEP-CTERM sorting domain-containing protein [Desulfobacter hydrogenophilus]NDY72138.1 PEP-CTERM sorting domain-containing protein [Desulfobacter hydrogenophilus]QBH14863.1 PEP-CTERM sorting domain-containing protein [Desulfobacter hydrogenophilus]RAM01371.1 hypothetical protein DO021_14205 [Desulfobacter hydrogenophilus]